MIKTRKKHLKRKQYFAVGLIFSHFRHDIYRTLESYYQRPNDRRGLLGHIVEPGQLKRERQKNYFFKNITFYLNLFGEGKGGQSVSQQA